MTEYVMDGEKALKKVTKMPNIETRTRISKDGKYIITEVIIRDIKPLKFYEKVLANAKQRQQQLPQQPAQTQGQQVAAAWVGK